MAGFGLLINYRTVLILIISVIASYLAIHYQIGIKYHLILYSVVIAFPLLFSLQSAFKRREKALEYISSFKAGLETSYQCFMLAKKLPAEKKSEIKNTLTRASDAMLNHLICGQPIMKDVFSFIDDVFLFMRENEEELSSRINLRVSRFMKDVYESAAWLQGIKRHRTILVLRIISYIFINVFPFFQAFILYDYLNSLLPLWTIYLFTLLTSFILITFYNVQLHIEYPFDQKGWDDIKVDDFRLDLK